MRSKKTVVLAFAVVICGFIVICASATLVFYHGAESKCYPVIYPEVSKPDYESFVPVTNKSNDPLETVKAFYNRQLNPVEIRSIYDYKEGTWRVEKMRDGYLYQCASLLNPYETEAGCIYIKSQDHVMLIETVWMISEAIPQCDLYLKSLP